MDKRIIIYSVFIGTLTFALLAAITMTFIVRNEILPQTPIVVYNTSVDKDLQAGFCPGQEIIISNTIDIIRPTLLELNLSVINQDNQVVWLPDNPVLIVPRQQNVGIKVQFRWIIPDLPPGKYTRVAAISSHNSDNEPFFNNFSFSIREDCPESGLPEEDKKNGGEFSPPF